MKSELKRTLVSLIITLIVVICGIAKNNIFVEKQKNIEINHTLAIQSHVDYDIYSDLDKFISANQDTFDFYTKTFGISIEDLETSILSNL